MGQQPKHCWVHVLECCYIDDAVRGCVMYIRRLGGGARRREKSREEGLLLSSRPSPVFLLFDKYVFLETNN